MNSVRENGPAIEWNVGQETLRVEPWGPDALRVRASVGPIRDGLPGALGELPGPDEGQVKLENDGARLVNGLITAELAEGTEHGQAMLRFTRTDSGAELLAEEPHHFWWPGPRLFTPAGNGYYRLEQRFRAYPDERVYGLGQHTHGLLDQKGAVIDLVQRNAEVTIPVLLSSRGYGLLWNNPAIGRVELATTATRWVADSARQIDYWITAGSPADILRRYAMATGLPPLLPEWAAGFWQSKLRYRTQDELLAVAREYHRRKLPLSVMVADYFHWTHLGDWRFDPSEWPDPAAMTAELAAMGIRLMVSVWPSVSPLSENYAELARRGLLIGTEHGPLAHATWPDKGIDAPVGVAFYDATNPDARALIWSRVLENYLRPYGIEAWWLDACEPELRPGFPANLHYHAGPGLEVGNLYPREHARAFYEGMTAEGRDGVVSFVRSAWAGSQRYGAALWSGDIPATFGSLRAQVRAGLNVAVSGIPWWTTDIGGFDGGDPVDPGYRELIVRWFQYGAFCPLFRLHGHREPRMPFGLHQTGGPNEAWSFGPDAYDRIREVLFLRERLRPYIMAQMRRAHTEGLPPMRPLFVDFPGDEAAWRADDAFMLGPDLLVAPVTEPGAEARAVYLPSGSRWADAWTGAEHDGGTVVEAAAPIDRIPLFLRDGASLPISART
ncbi:MAG TPA: TIM-barrel domain-containing protein [Streptosporangiaceae bacterium]|nr:TIM-barrel domain-containing protein [Streptosporangiaceae bacterium]